MNQNKYVREIKATDFEALMTVRLAVKENQLADSLKITKKHLIELLQQNSKGWLCEIEEQVVGFSLIDGENQTVWALFVHPQFEGMGIGFELHKKMMDWAFAQGFESVSLTTEAGTRAANFYKRLGWQKKGTIFNGEVRFVLNKYDWIKN